MGKYIHEQADWPLFNYDDKAYATLIGQVRHRQGRLIGHMEALGFDVCREAELEALIEEIAKTSEIEGEYLNTAQVRSSVARHLGLDASGLPTPEREVEGVVEMMMDATHNYQSPLTTERLFGWHRELFPAGGDGLRSLRVGQWRDDGRGPMQVVSGGMGYERVHFEAPAAARLKGEMTRFLEWFNTENTLDPVLKAAVAHLWFVTIHPFEDGNGRIARAIADMALARADDCEQRFYSMSAQILRERRAYYDILEQTQSGTLDVTAWIEWFLECLDRSLQASQQTLDRVMVKTKFWMAHRDTALNERQRLLANKLLEDFFGKLTSSKWAKIAKCSQDTAHRDILGMIEKGILEQEEGGGRSTSYRLRTAAGEYAAVQ